MNIKQLEKGNQIQRRIRELKGAFEDWKLFKDQLDDGLMLHPGISNLTCAGGSISIREVTWKSTDNLHEAPLKALCTNMISNIHSNILALEREFENL